MQLYKHFIRVILLNSYLRSVACDWQSLVTGEKSPKAVALSLVVHRLTGSKETIKLLHRSGAGISYDDVTKQIKSFSTEIQNNVNLAPKNISKGQPTHITTDNSDERQQTLTGLDTTHHTNATVYNPKNEETSTKTQEINDDDQEQSRPSTRGSINDCNGCKIGKPSPPPIIESYTDNTNHDQLDYRLSVDCAMPIGASITSSEEPSYPPLGSWTLFNSKTSNVKTYKSETGFLPVIPQPPSDSVCKYYLDFLLDLKSDLVINHIFCHSDQDIFYKISQIIWKDKKCDSVINIMGGFHILLVKLKILYKKYNLLGLQQWWLKSKIIAEGSVNQAAEGKHYSRAIRLHK